ncbi:MAG: hypothetical protein HDQ99_04685 [Lachnospiraceae bacterium]|nr:hypothetical protein [Lachnospiraceae bacterium]
MKVKCEFCDNYFEDTEQGCPYCGGANTAVGNYRFVNGAPKTIEELKQWTEQYNVPLAEMRVCIGDNDHNPKSIGIYRENTDVIIYKNESDGTRVIRYQGSDEAYAVNEVYLGIREMMVRESSVKRTQGNSNRDISYGGYYDNNDGYGEYNKENKINWLSGSGRLIACVVVMVFYMVLQACARIGISCTQSDSSGSHNRNPHLLSWDYDYIDVSDDGREVDYYNPYLDFYLSRDLKEADVPPAEAESEQEEVIKEELTMDKIKLLAEKGELCLQDLLVWDGLRESSLSSLSGTSEKHYYYMVLEEGKEYRLEFSSRSDGQLGFVRLVDMQTMLNIDIRTGNIEHLLCNEVRMEDYLTFAFPKEILVEDYDLYAGHFGGCSLTLVDENGTVPCGGIYILNGDWVSLSIVSGEMLAVAHYDNNIYHSEKERLSIEQCPALLTLMSVEEENGEPTQYYSVYFAQESDFYCYNLRLRADLFTKEEAIEIAQTVQFADRY